VALHTYANPTTALRGLARARRLHPGHGWFVVVEPNGFRYALAFERDGRLVYLARS